MRLPDWIEGWMRPAPPHREPKAGVRVVPRPQHRIAGAYQALHGYLDRRYADTAVLTFEQIESLIGFSLPDQARTHDEWWAGDETDAVASPHADAWRLAGRTATPNLRARTVAFDRVSS